MSVIESNTSDSFQNSFSDEVNDKKEVWVQEDDGNTVPKHVDGMFQRVQNFSTSFYGT